ncbi:MAG TPA: hypothetical protein VMB49_14650 [Acidobacteriaceae bacterium]|nr:hypothetical protein [Acidobacteriaceae bacterium]
MALCPLSRVLLVLTVLSLLSTTCAQAEPTPEAISAFNAYVNALEARLAKQHHSADTFFYPPLTPEIEKRLQQGEFIIESVTPSTASSLPGALLHDWRGTAFAPGATAADFERLLKNISSYPQYYAPQVLQARVLSQQGDHLQALMRVRQKHVLTVVLDTTYDITFGHLDAQHGWSSSRSIKISEIESPGTSSERALGPNEDHGFLWRLNSYWTYEEKDGGLYLQIESVSLTRSIPAGLNWIISPFIQKIPRESLEFTLQATCAALKK